MLASILSKAKAWLFDDPEDTDDLTDLGEMELQQRIRELERRTTGRREQLESLRDRYRSAVDRAGRVEEPELVSVRADLTAVLERTAFTRAKFLQAIRAKGFLSRLALAKRSDASIEGFDFDRDAVPTVVRDPVGNGLQPDGRTPTVGFDPPSDPEDLDAWGTRELGDVESYVDDVVAAARGDDPVPALLELIETDEDEEFDEFLDDQTDDDSGEAPGPEGRAPVTD
ncbi:hypothetical protein [Halorubellus litoreus]|uniref:Uncharacterized protein n=1 Tax=Halorubellus litoreus TaxID=755308 RepID=A0ABD5VLB6_9EURY